MKQKINFAQISRTVLWLGLIVGCGLTAARAQVIPSVCFEAKPETFTRTATREFNVARNFIELNQEVPHGFYALVVNPSGATEERFAYARTTAQNSIHVGGTGLPGQTFQFNHFAGETLLLIAEGDGVFGYHNTSSTAVTIPRGVSSNNYFSHGNLVYPSQPRDFQPGVHNDVVRIKVLSTLRANNSGDTVPTWHLNGSTATSTGTATQACATITYQGRLSDAGNAASGQFDLQFQAFDAETGGIAQGELMTLENVQVTNGVFTVPLFFGSTFTNNFKARFLEIGVRAGTSTGAFTTLTPRQPITSVPFAINAQTAQTALNVTTTNGFNIDGGTLNLNRNMLQLGSSGDAAHGLLYNFAINGAEFRGLGGFIWKTGTNGATERMSLDNAGNLGVAGNLTVNGTINGTATNAAQLGGVAASQYFRSTGGIVNGNLQANGDIAVGNDFFVARNTTIGGTLTVTGAINGTATNAAQLGGVPAANYLTNTGTFGQSVTTANGTGSLLIDAATTGYTLIPGLTQTINVPANSTLLISTDGGIQSSGAVNSYSVIDVAVFVDGALVGARRVIISNFPLPASVGNWALSFGQTLAPGSHTIEVRALNGFGGSANSNVSSGSDPLVRGQLTVAVIKK